MKCLGKPGVGFPLYPRTTWVCVTPVLRSWSTIWGITPLVVPRPNFRGTKSIMMSFFSINTWKCTGWWKMWARILLLLPHSFEWTVPGQALRPLSLSFLSCNTALINLLCRLLQGLSRTMYINNAYKLFSIFLACDISLINDNYIFWAVFGPLLNRFSQHFDKHRISYTMKENILTWGSRFSFKFTWPLPPNPNNLRSSAKVSEKNFFLLPSVVDNFVPSCTEHVRKINSWCDPKIAKAALRKSCAGALQGCLSIMVAGPGEWSHWLM